KVIQVTKDLVALGESTYTLVKKGKPSNTTEFGAISVVPKDKATLAPVDPFELENFSIPTVQSFRTVIRNARGGVAVTFDYVVVFSYGGTYEGSGRYLMGVMV